MNEFGSVEAIFAVIALCVGIWALFNLSYVIQATINLITIAIFLGSLFYVGPQAYKTAIDAGSSNGVAILSYVIVAIVGYLPIKLFAKDIRRQKDIHITGSSGGENDYLPTVKTRKSLPCGFCGGRGIKVSSMGIEEICPSCTGSGKVS